MIFLSDLTQLSHATLLIAATAFAAALSQTIQSTQLDQAVDQAKRSDTTTRVLTYRAAGCFGCFGGFAFYRGSEHGSRLGNLAFYRGSEHGGRFNSLAFYRASERGIG